MAVVSTNSYDGPFYPNGVATSFPFGFRAMAGDEVAIISESGDQIAGFDFTVLLDTDNDGGTVVFASPPTAVALPAFLIISSPDFGIAADLGSTTTFNPRSLNPSFDRLAVQAIFLDDQTRRSMKVPRGEVAGTMPALSARQGKVAVFSEDGGLVAVDSFGTLSQDIYDDGLWNEGDALIDDGVWG